MKQYNNVTYENECQKLTLPTNWKIEEAETGHIVFIREDYSHYITCGIDGKNTRLVVLLDSSTGEYPKPLYHREGRRSQELSFVSECMDVAQNFIPLGDGMHDPASGESYSSRVEEVAD